MAWWMLVWVPKSRLKATANAPGHQHPGQLLDGRARLFRPLLHLFHEPNGQQETGIKRIDPCRGNDAPIAASEGKKARRASKGPFRENPARRALRFLLSVLHRGDPEGTVFVQNGQTNRTVTG